MLDIISERPDVAVSYRCAGKPLDLRQPKVMGVINITPNAFYVASRCMQLEDIYPRAVAMVEAGAAIIDIGGESTSPGAKGPASLQEELDRVIPVVEYLAQQLPVPISVDTSQAQVMQEAISQGAGMINDVRALRLPGALAVVAQSDVPVCLMHMGYPDTATAPTVNTDTNQAILQQIKTFLQQRIDACIAAGIARERIIIDPGFGNGSFGKSTPQNLYLLKHLDAFRDFSLPILVGLSRKTFVGDVLNRPVEDRLAGSLALHVLSLLQGASLLRTHDVAATVDALKMIQAVFED